MDKIITILFIANFAGASWQRVINWSDVPLLPKKEVIKSDTGGVFIRTAIYGFNKNDTVIDGKNFQKIEIPEESIDRDTIRAGKPQIPYIKLLIAVPDSCGFNISVYPVDYTLFDNYLIYPVPRIVFEDSGGIFYYKYVYTFDTAFYQKDTFYPNRFYEIRSDGHWRDQRVLEVFLYPMQFNPQKRLMYFYAGIDLKIEYTGKKFPNLNGLGPFEDIGREMLLNYPGIDKRLPPRPPPAVHYYTDLLNPENVADYIIVTHDEFLINETTSRWIHDFAQWRVDHNRFDVGIVKVQDIYEQFGPSGHDSTQVRNFLIYAYNNWQAHASADNHFAYCLFCGDWDYVPTALRFASGGWVIANEYYFRDITGDWLDDIMLGRWPVKANQQLVTIAQKTINYEQSPTLGDWRRRGLLIAGDGDFDDEITSLKPYFTEIGYDTSIVRRSHLTEPEFIDSVNYYLNTGEIITIYKGHGSLEEWQNNYDTTQLKNLRNAPRLPVVFSDACLTAIFVWDHPYFRNNPNYPPSTCFGEHFILNPAGGAVGFWGALDYTSPQGFPEILKNILKYQYWILGMSLSTGIVYGDRCLLGDPALDLGDYTAYPNMPDLVVRPQGIDIELLPPYPYPNSGDIIPIQTAIWNIGRATVYNVTVNIKVAKEEQVLYSENIIVPEIKPRSSTLVTAHWNTGATHPGFYGKIGDCDFIVKADPNNTIEESWEYNNYSSITKKVALYPNQPGWPKKVTGFSRPEIGNLDASGSVEIVYAGFDSVYVFDKNGNVVSNWPQYFKSVSTIVLGDIDNNGLIEIVAISPESIKVYNYQGLILPGWPVQIPDPSRYQFYGCPVLGYIETYAQLNLVITAVPRGFQINPLKIFVYNESGLLMDEFNSSAMGNSYLFKGATIANIVSHGNDEIIVTYCYDTERGTYKTEIYNLDGLVAARDFGSNYMAPALVDLNNDGYADLIIGCSDNYIRAYDAQNDQLIWERPTEGPINSSPAVGDIYPLPFAGVEITFGNDGSAINLREKSSGHSIPPWSFIISPSTYVRTSPAIANINGDAYLDIIIGAHNQYIYAFKHTMDSIPPFPLPLFGIYHSSPIIGDIDGDRKSEIILSSSDGYLHIWKNRNSRVTQYLLEWPQFHHDYQRTGLYGWSP